MRFVAKLLSVLFFPLFIPLYGMLLLFSLRYFSFYPEFYIRSAYTAIIIFGTMVPLLSILILYKLKIIAEMGLADKRDRFLPYFCTSLSYLICASVLFRLAMPLFVVKLIVAVAIALLLNAIISIWWKISAHMTGVGGLFGGILCTSYHLYLNPYEWIIAIVLVCGMVAAARLYLNAHTPGQVVAGFLNGTLCTLIISNLNIGCFFSNLFL